MRLFPNCIFFLLLSANLSAQEAAPKFAYRDVESSGGRLSHVKGLPVLIVQGTPEEIGTQFGSIAVAQGRKLLDQVDDFVAEMGWKAIYPLMLRSSGTMLDRFPADHKAELLAAAKSSKVEKNLLVLANTIADLRRIGGCSTLVVEKTRSQTGEPLFGRNLDWPPFPGLAEHSLLVVCKPKGKHAYASLTISPLMGVITAMNDAGLCITINDIYKSADHSENFDPAGTPMMMLFRRVMEECTTLDEAEKLIRDAKRTAMYVLTLCDKTGGRALEATTMSVVARGPVHGMTCCTNHFRTDALCLKEKCDRYDKLEIAQKADAKLSVKDVETELDRVNQGRATIHSVVFEPASLIMRVAIGGSAPKNDYRGETASATKQEYRKIELKELFK